MPAAGRKPAQDVRNGSASRISFPLDTGAAASEGTSKHGLRLNGERGVGMRRRGRMSRRSGKGTGGGHRRTQRRRRTWRPFQPPP